MGLEFWNQVFRERSGKCGWPRARGVCQSESGNESGVRGGSRGGGFWTRIENSRGSCYTAAPVALSRRTIHLGAYRLGERLGLGGMAEVFAAECPEHGRVALKCILPSLADDRDFADMFWDEARITSRLEHPNIVKILDYGRVDGKLFMALEFVDGPALARVLRKAARAKQPLDVEAVLAIAVQLLAALDFVHTATDERGFPLSIVHRDVSPGNVLVSSQGQVKLGDFGIVRSDIVLRRTQPGELKGKIGYMSPEQAMGGPLDGRSDLFSVGVVLAELLILRPLLLGKSEMQTLTRTAQVDLTTWHRFNHDVPRPIRDLIEKALRKEPSERFASAGEMRQAILDVAHVLGLSTSPDKVRDALARLEMNLADTQPETGDGSGERKLGTLEEHPAPERVLQGRVLPASGEHELARPLGPAPRPTDSPIWRMSFDARSLLRQLAMALRRTRDGLIVLSSEVGQLSLEVRGGRIIAAHDSTGHAPLGRLLVAHGILGPHELPAALAESREQGRRLGEYLVSARRLRESALRRCLAEQVTERLGPWLSGATSGHLAVHLLDGLPAKRPSDRPSDIDGESDSLAQLVSVARGALDMTVLQGLLAHVQDSVLLPTTGADPATLGLTPPESRVLSAVLEGGALEGRSVRLVIEGITRERLAQPREAAFSILMGLCAGLVHASGF